MKKMIGILLIISITVLTGSSEVTKSSAEDGVIETRVEYWRAHAYVNLSLMQYQVNKIIKIDSLKQTQ